MTSQDALDRVLDRQTDYPESCSHEAGPILAALAADGWVLVSRDELAQVLMDHPSGMYSLRTRREYADAIIAAIREAQKA